MFKRIYLLCSLSILLFTACEKEVTNLKSVEILPKLVVSCFISPQDTMLRATLAKSHPVLGIGEVSNNNILNGSIIISDGITSVELAFNEKERLYTALASKMSIAEGKTYYLEANEPGGMKVSASCTVPVAPNPSLNVRVDSTATKLGDGSDGYEHYIRMQWQDAPGENNFYRVAADLITKTMYGDEYFDNVFAVFWPDEGKNQIMNDNELEGAILSSPNGYLTGLSNRTVSAQVYAYLLHTDKNYYLYHQSLRNSRVDNPFAEPVLIYTNIQGGLGVFAGYTKETAVVKFR